MEIIYGLIFIAGVLGIGIGFLYLLSSFRRVIIFDYERGVVYRQGKFHRILKSGAYWIFNRIESIQKWILGNDL